MSIEAYKQFNTRKASILTLDRTRPSGNPFTTHFGLRPLCFKGEEWPQHSGAPLFFVCQLNLTECPYVPDLLSDIKLITFFVAIEGGSPGREGGHNWIVRPYTSFDNLIPLSIPDGCSFERGCEGKWELVDDQPVFDDPDIIVPEGFDNSRIRLNNVHRTKIGGYASNIQSKQWWGRQHHADAPRYCFQIDSEGSVDLAWGNSGTIYIARGTVPDSKERWFLDCQSY